MWLLFARASPPDVPYWPGFAWVVLGQFDEAGGLFIALLKALLVLSAARRLHLALLKNHRYHFATWRWGCRVARMLAIAALLRHLI